MTDPVNHPSHYTAGAVECIDAIEAALGREGFIAYLRGQILKYQWRLGLKDAPEQDAAKAHWYSTRLQGALVPTWCVWQPGDQDVAPVDHVVEVLYTDKSRETGEAHEFDWSKRANPIIAAYRRP